MGAVTLSREEGDRIIEYVRGAIHDAIPKPEVPEEIKDLLMVSPEVVDAHPNSLKFCKDINDNVLEAFRRGRESEFKRNIDAINKQNQIQGAACAGANPNLLPCGCFYSCRGHGGV